MTSDDDTTAVNDRLTVMSKVRDLFGDTITPAQLQTITQFVLTGQTPIDPDALTQAARAMAEEDGRTWAGHSQSDHVRSTYTRRALIAITTYLTPSA